MYIENMYDRFLVARWCYLMGQPYLSDIEYDNLAEEFRLEYPTDIHNEKPWSFDECPVELLQKYGMSELICNPTMGYMAESIDSVNTEDLFERTFSRLNKKSRLSFKIDGWNTRVSYYNGTIVKVETRGRSGNNLNINSIYKLFPQTIPVNGRVAVTGELSIPNKRWADFKMLTGNADQRASVRTALARDAVEYLSFLAFNMFIEDGTHVDDPYVTLQEWGFKTPHFMWVDSYDKLVQGIRYMSMLNKGYTHLTDGLVIENENIQLAIRLGAWEEHSMASYVTGYEEDQGMYGTFLKVECYPIMVEGKKFSKISINNIANIVENNLKPGMPIAFNLRSSANVVLDVTETHRLQEKYKDNLEAYKSMIMSGN